MDSLDLSELPVWFCEACCDDEHPGLVDLVGTDLQPAPNRSLNYQVTHAESLSRSGYRPLRRRAGYSIWAAAKTFTVAATIACSFATSTGVGARRTRSSASRIRHAAKSVPVLAKQSPTMLDAIDQYSPVVIINGLAAVLFVIGYVVFGIAMIMTGMLPRWSAVLVAVCAPAHLRGFGIAQLVWTAAWPIAILGSASLAAGLARPGCRLWHTSAGSDLLAANRSTHV